MREGIMKKCCMVLWFMADSLWSADATARECLFPELPDYSTPLTKERDKYGDESQFKYRCSDGYHFKAGEGRHKIICNDGHWEPTNFWKCYDDCKNKCVHGRCVKTIGSSTSETVSSCECDEGYGGDNCDARVCESQPVELHHQHPLLKHGHVITGEKYSLGSIIQYRCVQNYIIKQGTTTATCTSNGWSVNSIPKCETNTCSMKEFLNGKYTPRKDEYHHGDSVLFNCYQGYVLNGEPIAKCTNGRWEPEWPSCTAPDRCPFPRQIAHGYIVSNGGDSRTYKAGDKVQYHCMKGYFMDGHDVVKCENRGDGYLSWGDPPHCYDDQSKACVGGNKVLKVKGKKLLCVLKPVITTTVNSVKPLTIVTATAGALLLLLLIVISLVAYQRRRIALNNRRHSGRERLTAEDDRYSFVYYSNDVHVVLPSYDEAMRVQGAPPPYRVDAPPNEPTVSNESGGNNEQLRSEAQRVTSCAQPNTETITSETSLNNINQGQSSSMSEPHHSSNRHPESSTSTSTSNFNGHISTPADRNSNVSSKDGTDGELDSDSGGMNPVNIDTIYSDNSIDSISSFSFVCDTTHLIEN